jgi:hypothetical protein
LRDEEKYLNILLKGDRNGPVEFRVLMVLDLDEELIPPESAEAPPEGAEDSKGEREGVQIR